MTCGEERGEGECERGEERGWEVVKELFRGDGIGTVEDCGERFFDLEGEVRVVACGDIDNAGDVDDVNDEVLASADCSAPELFDSGCVPAAVLEDASGAELDGAFCGIVIPTALSAAIKRNLRTVRLIATSVTPECRLVLPFVLDTAGCCSWR